MKNIFSGVQHRITVIHAILQAHRHRDALGQNLLGFSATLLVRNLFTVEPNASYDTHIHISLTHSCDEHT